MVVICCVCQKQKTDDGWVRQPVLDSELPSHGYCPVCAAEARLEIEAMRRERNDGKSAVA